MDKQRRALYLSHGGGPLPLLGDESHEEMVSCLQRISKSIEKPSAIILVSAHWEAAEASVISDENPGLLYDYGGFPPEAYAINYPCRGNPELASLILEQLKAANIKVMTDAKRKFDHGLFVPLKIMYPEADIPCVQISLIRGLDPKEHIDLGRALQNLADSSILLIGSGSSYHNQREIFGPGTEEAKNANESFEEWIKSTCVDQSISEIDRSQKLVNWESVPYARFCHPREEHLLPLHVCYGYTESACSKSYGVRILNREMSMHLWDMG